MVGIGLNDGGDEHEYFKVSRVLAKRHVSKQHRSTLVVLAMNEENRLLVTDEAVEFAKEVVEVQDFS